MRLVEGAVADQGGARYAIRRERGSWVLSMRERSTMTDLYEFTDDPQTAGDIEVANHYTSTHPASMFRRTLTIQRTTLAERVVLRSDAVVRFRDGITTEEPIDRARLRTIVRDLFGIDLTDATLLCESESEEVRK